MKAIWKYSLPFQGRTEITMPKRAEILCVQEQDSTIHLWALVKIGDRSDVTTETRAFSVFGTGDVHETFGRYVGTAQTGPFVWHVFEEVPA